MSSDMEQNAAPDEERVEPVPQPAEPAISPGQELARRREELNLTVEQVAGQLNLAPRQVEAIESDNFDALPGMAIARGFVRSYAKLVRLDAEPLLAAMAPAVAPMPEARPVKQTYVAHKPLSGDRLTFGQKDGRKSKAIWIVLALVVVVAIVAAFEQMDTISMPSLTPSEAPRGVAQEQVPEQDGQAVEVLPAPELPAEQAPESPAPAETPGTELQSALPPEAVPLKLASTTDNMGVMAESGDNELVLKMREESWVELKRADGAIIAARLMEAGAVERFPLKGGASLVVGNASGVDATLGGEPLDLQTKARANVARLNLK
jgi:cytoskeleton protein RodZ